MTDPNPPQSTRSRRGTNLRQHQWPEGFSGNPRGRPRKAKKSLSGHLQAALDETVTVTIGGEARTISKQEAMAIQLANKVAGGDLQAMGQLRRLLAEPDTSGFAASEESAPLMSPGTLQNLVARLRSATPETLPEAVTEPVGTIIPKENAND